jgi:hypothetical protein
MPSPFPGMNPYLERADVWNDFHNSFIPAARELLTAQIQPRYYVRIEEHLFIHEPSARERFPRGRVVMPCVVTEERLPYLEIRDRARNEVVTILELLSPTNKATGSNRDQYLAKGQRSLASNTNFVEIDLLWWSANALETPPTVRLLHYRQPPRESDR